MSLLKLAFQEMRSFRDRREVRTIFCGAQSEYFNESESFSQSPLGAKSGRAGSVHFERIRAPDTFAVISSLRAIPVMMIRVTVNGLRSVTAIKRNNIG
jgi:hypothetical protein